VYTRTEGRQFTNCAWPADGNVSTNDPTRNANVWGKVCQPTYDILQGPPIFRGNFPVAQLAPDRFSNTMMLMNVWGQDVLPIRFSNSERNMSFTAGNAMSTGFAPIGSNGLAFTPNSNGIDQRPAAFDPLGTMWWSFKEGSLFDAQGHPLLQQDMRNWVGSTDVNQLFAPRPIVLTMSTTTPTTVQAEITTPVTAQKSGVNGCQPATAGCQVLVDTTANVRPCTDGFCVNGYELSAPSGAAFFNRSAAYSLWAPQGGKYKIKYRFESTRGQHRRGVRGPRRHIDAADEQGREHVGLYVSYGSWLVPRLVQAHLCFSVSVRAAS
jgi:hypothetical protein